MSVQIKNELIVETSTANENHVVHFSPNNTRPENTESFNQLYVKSSLPESCFTLQLEDLPHVVNFIKTFYNDRVSQDKKIY